MIVRALEIGSGVPRWVLRANLLPGYFRLLLYGFWRGKHIYQFDFWPYSIFVMFLVKTVDKPANRMFIVPQITLSTNPTKSLRWSECLVWSLTTRTWRTCRVSRDSVYSAKPGVFPSCDTCSVPCGTTSSVSTDWEVLEMGVVVFWTLFTVIKFNFYTSFNFYQFYQFNLTPKLLYKCIL